MLHRELEQLWLNNSGNSPLVCKMLDGRVALLILGPNSHKLFGLQRPRDEEIIWLPAAQIVHRTGGLREIIPAPVPPDDLDISPVNY